MDENNERMRLDRPTLTASARRERERECLKSVNHARKTHSLFQPQDKWFQSVLWNSGLAGLCASGYNIISHGMQAAFAERYHSETSSFLLLIGEMTVTLNFVACFLHPPFRGRFLDHSKITKADVVEIMVVYLGGDLEEAFQQCKNTRGAHAKFSLLEKFYNKNFEIAENQDTDDL
ncbi:uncharacterized protein LOC131625997 [Vicia villosa]|uniref:uncharacterized protein LOC131625997 n=1 Tax=Vicia villosa TaxID=3911 RepID=UPI00273B01DF|nr:uncharacterized protein LOC131625997 [Vicia villosa]